MPTPCLFTTPSRGWCATLSILKWARSAAMSASGMAYTEAPESLQNLAKQRFRWAFGTLQCLWKHQGALGQHGAFGWIALPSLWLYQILFPAISPFMDIAILWSLFAGNFAQFAG